MTGLNQNIKVALIDDHQLMRKGLAELINGFPNYSVLFEASNGLEMQTLLHPKNLPDIILMDINMPKMNGYESVFWLSNHYPDIPVLALSMINHEESILRMLKLGVKGYLLKDIHPLELKNAMDTLIQQGFLYTDYDTGKVTDTNKLSNNPSISQAIASLRPKDLQFISLCCTELSYKEIADLMCVSPRTIDGYRERMFEKFEIKSRVGLAMFAIRNGLVEI